MVYTGDDFLEKMLKDREGNVVVISGNNKKKTEYIKACVDEGLNVLADKPLTINAEGFRLLEEAFAAAEKNNVLLYDIMTERSEITSILQKELINNTAVFGQIQKGSQNEPAVVMESIHHFFKSVAGNPIRRPAWYFDAEQQGEGIVDVTTHLVDMVMWTCLPQEAIDYKKDIDVKKARRWPTMITQQQFEKVTALADFPDFLKEKLNNEGYLPCYANGEMIYTLKGVYVKLTAKWNYQAPEGAGDSHFSMIRGSKASVIIRQGKEQNYRPELYVEPAVGASNAELAQALQKAVTELQGSYLGLELEPNFVEAFVLTGVLQALHRTGHTKRCGGGG